MKTRHISSRRKRARVVVITGGTHGLGRSLAVAFAAAGDSVWCLARSSAGRAPRGVGFIRADILDAPGLAAATAAVCAEAGAIDVWINNAGGGRPVPFVDADQAAWQVVFDLNFTGTVNGCRAAMRVMRDRGSIIINIASLAGLMAPAGHSAYTCAKAAVIALTQSLAVEYASAGIRVNAVAPGPLDTSGFRATGGSAVQRARSIPTHQLVRPVEVASACLWLCEPNGSVTGQTILIDGGASAAGCYV